MGTNGCHRYPQGDVEKKEKITKGGTAMIKPGDVLTLYCVSHPYRFEAPSEVGGYIQACL